MSDLPSSLWGMLNAPVRQPVAILLYDEDQAREQLMESIELMSAQGQRLRRTAYIEDAFGDLDQVLLLTPADEVGALRELAGRREALVERNEPVILFLLRGGSASKHLSDPELAGLMGWTRGHTLDPARLSQVDVEAAREHFIRDTGTAPEDWLSAWRRGELPDTLDNQLWFHQALLLAERQPESQGA